MPSRAVGRPTGTPHLRRRSLARLVTDAVPGGPGRRQRRGPGARASGVAAAGRREGAVRCAFWLAFSLLNRGELARAGGWPGPGGSDVRPPGLMEQICSPARHPGLAEATPRSQKPPRSAASRPFSDGRRRPPGPGHGALGRGTARAGPLDEAMVAVGPVSCRRSWPGSSLRGDTRHVRTQFDVRRRAGVDGGADRLVRPTRPCDLPRAVPGALVQVMLPGAGRMRRESSGPANGSGSAWQAALGLATTSRPSCAACAASTKRGGFRERRASPAAARPALLAAGRPGHVAAQDRTALDEALDRAGAPRGGDGSVRRVVLAQTTSRRHTARGVLADRHRPGDRRLLPRGCHAAGAVLLAEGDRGLDAQATARAEALTGRPVPHVLFAGRVGVGTALLAVVDEGSDGGLQIRGFSSPSASAERLTAATPYGCGDPVHLPGKRRGRSRGAARAGRGTVLRRHPRDRCRPCAGVGRASDRSRWPDHPFLPEPSRCMTGRPPGRCRERPWTSPRCATDRGHASATSPTATVTARRGGYRTWIGATSLAVGPLVMAVATSCTPRRPGDILGQAVMVVGTRRAGISAHLLLFIGAVLFVPGC